MKDYFTKGPAAGRSTMDFFIGSFLFWKVWAVVVVVTVGYFGGAVIAMSAAPNWIYPAGFVAGFLTNGLAERVTGNKEESE